MSGDDTIHYFTEENSADAVCARMAGADDEAPEGDHDIGHQAPACGGQGGRADL